ncbi:MAG: hypothetical protein GY771_10945 [bacterium]|nr:hypothetical protein [bacterium]
MVNSEEQSLVKSIENMFTNLQAKLESQNQNVVSELVNIRNRLDAMEERASSQQIVIENLVARVGDLEAYNETLEARLTQFEATSADTHEWEPSGSCETKILLLGDSNSSGKIKFGDGKGTLGGALPGSSTFVPKVDILPDPESEDFTDISDIIIAVGTNDLKVDTCVPEHLAKKTYEYVKKVTNKHSATHVFLPGVLPVCTPNSEANIRISKYNHYLNDMCTSLPKVTFIDTKTFATKGGSLQTKFAQGEADPLHLNTDGIKLYSSRIKFALRARYNLPNRRRVNNRRWEEPGHGNGNGRGRGGGRGGRGGRGSRGTDRGRT